MENKNWFPLDDTKIKKEPDWSEDAKWLINNFLENVNLRTFVLGLKDTPQKDYLNYWPLVSENFTFQLKKWLLLNGYKTWDVQVYIDYLNDRIAFLFYNKNYKSSENK